MITHAYVRYQDDKHLAIVPVEDIKNFNPNEDYSTAFFMVKWTDSTGTCAYYRARILRVGESEQDLKEIVSRKRVRVRPLIEDSDQASDGDSNVAPSKEQDKPSESRERLLKILQKKKKAVKVSPSQEAELNELQKKVAEMQKKIDAQNEELVELRGLNRDLQKELLVKIREGSSRYKSAEPTAQSHSPGTPLPHSMDITLPAVSSTPSPPSSPTRECPHSPLKAQAGASGGSLVDIGQGLRIPLETWRRVQARDKDSLFIKDLLVTIWDPAQLQGRSLQGKHCPRFPNRPRKDPLTPWKVSVMRTCYKRRLEKQGFPDSAVQTLMKRMNHYVGEKIAGIDKMAKRVQRD
nr:BEN domain-containing protein 5-like [Rhipicephalus microplus]